MTERRNGCENVLHTRPSSSGSSGFSIILICSAASRRPCNKIVLGDDRMFMKDPHGLAENLMGRGVTGQRVVLGVRRHEVIEI